MARRSNRSNPKAAPVTNHRHAAAKRKNNPPAALVGEAVVPTIPKAQYAYSPRLSPKLRSDPTGKTDLIADLIAKAQQDPLTADEAAQLRDALSQHEPWLEWAAKQEQQHKGLAVDPVALHIHERISAQAILNVARRKDVERSLFADPQQAYHEAVQFYQHDIAWANRLILGDSLLVMSSLARREDLAGKVQMIYIDPPYGIKFASNFQPQVGQRDVKDKDSDLTREAEMVKAYRDTWHLGVHSYLAYLRDRLIVAKELLADTGSIFVQISDENLHRVRQVMDEVFGAENFCGLIAFKKTGGFEATGLPGICDYLLWHSKSRPMVRFRQMFSDKALGEGSGDRYNSVYLNDGNALPLSHFTTADGTVDIPDGSEPFLGAPLTSSGASSSPMPFDMNGRQYWCKRNQHWKTNAEGVGRLIGADRVFPTRDFVNYRLQLRDFPALPITNMWTDTMGTAQQDNLYVVPSPPRAIERCMLMTTAPGDLVLDPTCGGGTTAYVAEQWGRRWITIDTSRVAVALARQRLLTAKFDRYRLAGEDDPLANGQGIDPSANFVYKTVPHVTLGSIARNQNLDPIFAKHEPILEAKRRACNAAMGKVTDAVRAKMVAKLAKKMEGDGVRAATDADKRRWLLPGTTKAQIETAFASGKKLKANHVREALAAVPVDGKFEHWHVPFDTDEDWPVELAKAVKEYRGAWRAKMDEVNACIDANAEQETLVDQPEVVRGVVRVTGPLTVEAVQPPEMTLGEPVEFDGAPDELDGTFETRFVEARPEFDVKNLDAYLDTMIRLLKADGVRFPDNRQMKFSRLERREDVTGTGVHAEGRWVGVDQQDEDPEGAATVAIVIGPQYGPVNQTQVIEAMRWALRRAYTDIVFAGFSFDAAGQAEIENYAGEKLKMHLAHIRPDINPAMDGLLKDPAQPGGGQLFAVFGQPRVSVAGPDGDGQYTVTMEGVDVYDPVQDTVKSTGASKVAAWFLDGDYDGQTFCVTQAFFPDASAWDKLARALGDAVDGEAFAAFSGTTSLPFAPGKHKKAAVKVIDPRGNEVMKIVKLGDA